MGNTLATDTMGPQTRKVYNGISWIFTSILLLAILIYAGIRGHVAYNQIPTTSVNFMTTTSVNFPAFTFCPLDAAIRLIPVACEPEYRGVLQGSCLNTMTPLVMYIEGANHSCFSFNSVPATALVSNTSLDEIGIQMTVDSTSLPNAHEKLGGAYVFVHAVGTPPLFLDGRSFMADVAKITEAFLHLDQISYLNGTTQNIYRVVTSSASVLDTTLNLTMDIDFWFNPLGVYVNKQYRPYTPDMWIGEVGGFACLFTFLHFAAMFLVMLVYRQLRKEPVSSRFQDERA